MKTKIKSGKEMGNDGTDLSDDELVEWRKMRGNCRPTRAVKGRSNPREKNAALRRPKTMTHSRDARSPFADLERST